MSPTPILDRIQSPADVKALKREELPLLAADLRKTILDVVTVTGGHLGSGMGVVELTIALHRVFDLAKDRLVFDVGHQVYPHKLLTGRKDRFHTLRQKGGLSGFTNPKESPCDVYTMGHAGTATSAALGIASGDNLEKTARYTIALVGDAAMGAGCAFEALNFAGSQPNVRTLIILNDNSWSISKTVGALSRYLDRVRAGPVYTQARKRMHDLLQAIPLIGKDLDEKLDHALEHVRRLVIPGQVFEELGLQYFGPIDGHDVFQCIDYLERVKDLDGPVLLHVRTKKGHGVPGSESAYDRAHAAKPRAKEPERREPTLVEAGKTEPCVILPAEPKRKKNAKPWTNWFAEGLEQLAARDEKVVALTAAMPDGTGLMDFAARFPERFFDVGIAEQHCVAFASGLAVAGLKPFAAIYSTFLQRAYDQVFQEVLIQNLPVVFAMDRAGIVGEDGMTHNGLFDIAYLRALPNIVLMAPKDGPELHEMLAFAAELGRPCGIRYARGGAPGAGDLPGWNGMRTAIELGRMEVLRPGRDGAILAYGAMVQTALEAAELLAQKGVAVEVVNARFVKPIDVAGVRALADRHDRIVTLEDHSVVGGFGSAVLEACAGAGPVRAQIAVMGVPDRFLDHAGRGELLKEFGLDAAAVAARFLSSRTVTV
ncbi:MAG: 1-deoxy-D-xylulose-5-phosphate synthase [Planctomycetes bacterium]|nr:1-deoxy-D-xylulose-5-phosphate synthase [Planctomycetota bacterium]